MPRFSFAAILAVALLLSLCGCREYPAGSGGNAVYYWRTTFSLSDVEREFLKEHDVKKIYLRFFDVDAPWISVDGEDVVPEATIQFNGPIPAGIEIVPTVYITVSAMQGMQLEEDEYAGKIYSRVNAICLHNGIAFHELQLDCDWTKSSRKHFFRLCEEMKLCMDSTQTLSSTIRLHQLTQTPPPVDKGVLMMYNTGNLMQMTTDNSIFSRKDIEPYLRDNRLSNYSLPLDVAYPIYGWSILFRPVEGKYIFERIMRRTDFSGYPSLKKIDGNVYEAIADVGFSQGPDSYLDVAYENDRIKVERPSAKEILEIKSMVEKQLKDKPHCNILYHLDESQLSHYSDNEISKIYNRN